MPLPAATVLSFPLAPQGALSAADRTTLRALAYRTGACVTFDHHDDDGGPQGHDTATVRFGAEGDPDGEVWLLFRAPAGRGRGVVVVNAEGGRAGTRFATLADALAALAGAAWRQQGARA
jgi:hypothetical protein